MVLLLTVQKIALIWLSSHENRHTRSPPPTPLPDQTHHHAKLLGTSSTLILSRHQQTSVVVYSQFITFKRR